LSFLLLLPLISLCTITGCVEEDMDDCGPTFNVSLLFSLPGENGEDMFLAEINSVDVMILDSVGRLIRTEHLDRAALELYQGVQLILDPGRYRITCWANQSTNTAYDPLTPTTLPGSISYITVDPLTNLVGDSDPLYRAPRPATNRLPMTATDITVDGLLTLEVPPRKEVIQPVEFAGAHHRVMVRVLGYSTQPIVEMDGIPVGNELLSGLSMLDPTQALRRVTSQKQTVAAEDGNGSTITFLTFPFAFDDRDIHIRLIDPFTGSVVVDSDNILVDHIVGAVGSSTTVDIVVTITFNGLSVSVKVELVGWGGTPVNPGY
jgi:hypothetical protein